MRFGRGIRVLYERVVVVFCLFDFLIVVERFLFRVLIRVCRFGRVFIGLIFIMIDFVSCGCYIYFIERLFEVGRGLVRGRVRTGTGSFGF